MTYNLFIYSIAIFLFFSYLFIHFRLRFGFALLATLLCNLPLISSLSIPQWLDSLCGNPSLFLALLCLGSIGLTYKPLFFYQFHLPSLNIKSKVFILIFGFILFWGNLNYLWGIDLFNASFHTQILIALGIVLLAYYIQPYLGVLLLLSCIGYLIRGGNIFSYMMDALVWLYALISLLILVFMRKEREK